jgi:HK97 family phage major capsid protein
MRTIEDIHAQLQGIVDAAEGRSFTDDEVTAYEALEGELEQVRRSTEIRARQTAYNMPAPGLMSPVAVPKPDDGLDKAFENYLRTGQPNSDISGLRVTNEQGEGGSAAGGYTVPSGFRRKLVEVRKAFGGFASHVDSFSTGDGRPIEYPSLDDTANTGTITAEGAAVADGADLTFGIVNLGAYKYTSSGANDAPLRVSVELLQDSAFDIAGLVARKLGERIARKQAPHWVTGTGVGQPKGIVAASLTADRDLDTADTPDYEDLVEFQDLLDEAYDENASWLMKRNTWAQLRLLVDLQGRPILQSQADSIQGRPQRMLLGKPVVIDEAMPTLSSAADTFAIVYGDLREAYVIRRVSNLAVVVNPYTRASYGQVEYTAWERADGTVQNRSAYKILQNNT